MTQTRKWSAGAAVIVVLVLVASWFLLISPKRATAADLQAQTVAQEDANALLTTQIALLQQQAKDLPEQQARLAQLESRIPATPSLSTLIRQLTTAADQAGVDMVSLTPSTPVALGAPSATGLTAGQLTGINVNIMVTGGYFEMQQYLAELERLERAFLVTGMNLTENDSAATDEGSTDGSSTGGATTGELTGTIDGRVFLVPAEVATTETATTTTTAGSTTTPAE